MAAPKRNALKPDDPRQADTRAAIQTTQLIKRLQKFALAEVDGKTKEPIDINTGRLKAIEILLRKSLPDLSNVTIEGGGPDGEFIFRTFTTPKPD